MITSFNYMFHVSYSFLGVYIISHPCLIVHTWKKTAEDPSRNFHFITSLYAKLGYPPYIFEVELSFFTLIHSVQWILFGTPYLKPPGRSTFYLLSPPTGVLPEPKIRGIENWLFTTEDERITCHVSYHWTQNVTFNWELDEELGSKLNLPGYMRSIVQHKNNTATFVWALNFTFEHGHSGYKLRCIVRVDNTIHRNYRANDERNLFHGMSMKLCV